MSRRLDVVVIGAGFAGLYLLHTLRARGLHVAVLEAGGDVGGTWYWNRYPGSRCDVESIQYSYSFSKELDQEWIWSERYAAQPEILRYLQHVAQRFDLRRDIHFNSRVASATYSGQRNEWEIVTETGDKFAARFCVMATGCLSRVNRPNIPGADTFAGEIYHTGSWPHSNVEFSGKRVGIIGTGSSACQAIPVIAQTAKQLVVFQRTPNHCVPARNYPLRADYVGQIKRRYPELRRKWRASLSGSNFAMGNRSALEVTPEELELTYSYRWEAGGIPFQTAFDDLLIDMQANATATDFINRKIDAIVTDPQVARRLKPIHHPFGTKRICIVTDYYETFNRSNVRLINLRETPIEEIVPSGARVEQESIPLDMLIYATGFDSMTGALAAVDIRGRDGVTLKDAWAHGPDTYLGLMVAKFPNLFLITGPGSPSVLTVVTMSIEQHVEWIDTCLAHMDAHDYRVIEADPGAQRRWMDHVREVAAGTLYPRADSWYTNANIEGKRRNFSIYVGGFADYDSHLQRVAARGYSGFELTRVASPASDSDTQDSAGGTRP